MIVFYKNYKRTDRTILSIQSVRHLFPEIEIRCLLLHDEDPKEYFYYMSLFKEFNVKTYNDKKKYNFGASGVGSAYNGYYFTEGINKIYDIVKDEEQKVFILDEDEFFTTGETIRFLLNTEFDLAYSHWLAPSPIHYARKASVDMNGAFLAIRPSVLKKYFPLLETKEYIEILLGHELHDKCKNDRLNVVNIPTRYNWEYYGDGFHGNDVELIKEHLTKANIPFKL